MITVQVRGGRGDVVLSSECRLDWVDLRHVDENEFPCLGSLLPYADTIFNERQVIRVRRELESQRIRELLGVDTAVEIERLCLAVEGGLHRYLWFLGD